MVPIKVTVDANDPISKAACVMLQVGFNLIPVMDGEKVAGVLRMSDIFNELTKVVIE
jgi:CBS domain-containing protein